MPSENSAATPWNKSPKRTEAKRTASPSLANKPAEQQAPVSASHIPFDKEAVSEDNKKHLRSRSLSGFSRLRSTARSCFNTFKDRLLQDAWQEAEEAAPDLDIVGLQWDTENYSCSYDAMITIMWNMWKEDMRQVSECQQMQNKTAKLMFKSFKAHAASKYSLEDARDKVRKCLHKMHREIFPKGQRRAHIEDLCFEIFTSRQIFGIESTKCTQCNTSVDEYIFHAGVIHITDDLWRKYAPGDGIAESLHMAFTKDILKVIQNHKMETLCPICESNYSLIVEFKTVPQVFAVSLHSKFMIQISYNVLLQVTGQEVIYKLRGVIYLGGYHYTARFIDNQGGVWYNDGMQTGRECIFEGHVSTLPESFLSTAEERTPKVLIYSTF
ncbi:hypothetical protein DFH11DRAFT_1214872 [Phellopilus nigrolimitatus]|nr:hypothetical protein DFH11DRAFT_1214872 [Phellopilus nigrolimitatus]